MSDDRIDPAAILASVANDHRIPLHVILSRQATRPVALARFDAMTRMRDAGMSLTQIGRFLNRDHSTVLNGLRRFPELKAQMGQS